MPIKITQKLGNKKKQFNVLTKEELSELFGGNIARAGEVIGRTAELNNKLDQVSDNVNTAVEESFQEAGFFYNDTINEVTDALNRSIQEGGNELSYNDVESSQANGLLVTGYDRTTDPDTPISRINLRGDGTTSDGVSFAGIHIQKFDTDSNIWETNFWANSAGDLFMNGNLQLAEGSILVGTRDDFENGRAGVFIDPDLGVVVQGDTNVANVARVILSGEGTDEDQNAYSGINIQGWDDEDNKWVSNFYADPDGNIFLRGRIEATEGFLGDLEVQGMLQSSNYQETTEEEGGDGFRIEGSTGDAYFNRIFVRGEDPDNRYLRGSLIDGDALGWDGSKLNIRFGNNVSYDDVNDKIDADPTNLGYTDQFNDGIEITSTTGSNVTIPLANASTGGFMGTNDWQKLDGIDEDADNYSHWRITGDDTGTGSVGSGQTVTFSGSKLTSVTRSGVAMTIESSWNIGDGGDQPTEVDGSQNVNFTGRENSTTQEIYIDTELSGQSVLFDLNLGSLDNRFLQELTYITDSSDPLAPVKISISDGNEITLQEASSNNAGLLSASDYDFIQDLETDISDLEDAKVLGVSFNSNVRGLTINQEVGSVSTTLSNVAMENRENTFQDHQNFDTSISVNTASTTYDVNVGGTVNASNLSLNGTPFHQRAYTWTDTQTFDGDVNFNGSVSGIDTGISASDNVTWTGEHKFNEYVSIRNGNELRFYDSTSNNDYARMDARDNSSGSAVLHKYTRISGSSSRWKERWYDGSDYHDAYAVSTGFRFNSNVGVGRSASSSRRLHVQDSGSTWVQVDSSSTGNTSGYLMGVNGSWRALVAWRDSGKHLRLGTSAGSSSAMVITEENSVGINTDNPSRTLEVRGDTTGQIAVRATNTSGTTYAGMQFLNESGGNNGYFLSRYDGTSLPYYQNGITLVADGGHLGLASRGGNDVRILTDNTMRMRFRSSGNITVYNSLEPRGGLILPDQPAT